MVVRPHVPHSTGDDTVVLLRKPDSVGVITAAGEVLPILAGIDPAQRIPKNERQYAVVVRFSGATNTHDR
jgi:hypothetical protein